MEYYYQVNQAKGEPVIDVAYRRMAYNPSTDSYLVQTEKPANLYVEELQAEDPKIASWLNWWTLYPKRKPELTNNG